MSNRGRGPTRDHPEDGSAGLSRKRMLHVANHGPPKVGTLPVRGTKKHRRGGFRGARGGAATDVGLPPSVGAVSTGRGGGSSSGSRGHHRTWSGRTFDFLDPRRDSSDRQGSSFSSGSRHAHPLPPRPPPASSSRSQDEQGPSTKRARVDNNAARLPHNAGRYTSESASAMTYTGYASYSPPAASPSTLSGYVPPFPAPKPPVPSDPMAAREEANVVSTSKSVVAPSMPLAADEAVGHETTASKPPKFTPRNHNQRENDPVPSSSTLIPPPGPAKELSPAPPPRLKVVPRNHNVRPNAPAPTATAPLSPTTLLPTYMDNSYSANRPAPKWNPNIKPRNHNIRKNDPVPPAPPPTLPEPQALLSAAKPASESRAAALPRSVTPTATSSEPEMARQRSAPVQLHSSPEVASQSPEASSKLQQLQLPPLDIKPDIAALEAAELAAAVLREPTPPTRTPDEGVAWIRLKDLPEDCCGRVRASEERKQVRNAWLADKRREFWAKGKVIVGAKFRGDGVGLDWRLRATSAESEDDFEVLDEDPQSAGPSSPADAEDDFEILTLEQVPQFATPPQPVFTVSSPEPEPLILASRLPPEPALAVPAYPTSPVAGTSHPPPPQPFALNPSSIGQSDQTEGRKRQRSMSPADKSPHQLARMELPQHQSAPQPPSTAPSSAVWSGPAPVASVTPVKRVYTLSSSVTPVLQSEVQPLPFPSCSPQRLHGESPTLRAKSEPHGMRSIASGPSASPAILTGESQLAQLHALMDKELDKLDRWTRLIEMFPTREPSLRKQIERTEDTIFSLQNEMDEETRKMDVEGREEDAK